MKTVLIIMELTSFSAQHAQSLVMRDIKACEEAAAKLATTPFLRGYCIEGVDTKDIQSDELPR